MKQELLEQYAAFAVRVGVNPQPSQTLIIRSPIEGAEFARLCAKVAYDAGARDVVIFYEDEQFSRLRMERADVEALEDVKPWTVRRYLDYAESEGGCCLLSISSKNPELYKGLDPEKVDRANKAAQAAAKPWRPYVDKSLVQWTIAAIPSPAWAGAVFPGDPDGVEKLWEAIFQVCRVKDGEDVVENWKVHTARLERYRNRLNELDLDHIRLVSANGTDLTIGLADGAIWEGASEFTPDGVEFIANIPTEEVFTAPHRERVNGVVKGTRPYVFNGDLIDGFSVTFRDGRAVDCSAEKNEHLLRQLLESDENACRIGEIALVPASSPIYQSGLLFYNTLFDENAACHIAFGRGYPSTVKGGISLSDEELVARGVNVSLIHEDVMVGAPDMTITGVTRKGETVAIFEQGEWVL